MLLDGLCIYATFCLKACVIDPLFLGDNFEAPLEDGLYFVGTLVFCIVVIQHDLL